MLLIVIPARLQSTRLPRKPLAMIGDYPLLWWTWQKARKSRLASRVVIATDSLEIQNTMQAYGAECFMTSEDCQSGSDRAFEVAKLIPEAEIIVNLQGDEPLMEIEMLDGTIQTLLDNSNCQIATAVAKFSSHEEWQNPNQVKAVFNRDNRAIYFSRAPLADGWLHLGLYVYKRPALEKFCTLPPSPLELAERLEQLRAIEAEIPIYVYKSNLLSAEHFGVDTPSELERASKILLNLD